MPYVLPKTESVKHTLGEPEPPKKNWWDVWISIIFECNFNLHLWKIYYFYFWLCLLSALPKL
jgi:hypothetical protein